MGAPVIAVDHLVKRYGKTLAVGGIGVVLFAAFLAFAWYFAATLSRP